VARDRWDRALACGAVVLCLTPSVEGATIYVAAGGDLQTALNAARQGDTVFLAANAEFVGNFVLPLKTGDEWITAAGLGADSHRAAGSRLFLQERGDDLLCARPAAPPPPSFDRHSFTPFEIVAKDRVQLLG
jgi:hypothetical protein